LSLRKEAARGVFWTAVSNWGYQLTTLVIFAILSRLLDPTAFGLVALASVFVNLMALVEEQGMADALVQRADLEPEHLDTAFWVSVGLATVLAIGIGVSSTLIADLVNEPDVAPILVWLALSLVFAGLSSVQRAVLTREMRFASLTARRLVSVVVGGIAGVSAAFAGLGAWSLVIEILTRHVVSVVVLWTASPWRPGIRFSRSHFRELFSFGSSVLGFKLLRFGERRIDNLMIGSLIGATALGFYVVAYRLLNLLINATTSVMGTVAFPVFSRIQADSDQILRAYYKAIRLTGLISFPAFLGVIAIAPEATRLVFGSQWDASVPVMRVLAIAGVAQSLLFVNGVVLKSLGRPGWRLAIMALSVLVLVVAFAVTVQWGIIAVAWALVGVTYAFAPLWVGAVHRLIGLSPRAYLSQIGAPLGAALVMAAVVVGLKPLVDDWGLAWRVPALVLAGMAVYGSILWATAKPMAMEAFRLIRLAIPNRTRQVVEG
jgi:O-antigen/teichoic acid export membrane protein